MFWKSVQKEVEAVEPKIKNVLIVTFRDNRQLTWTLEDWKGENFMEPWQPFFNWFSKGRSATFIIPFTNGNTMICRSEILLFTAQLK